MGRWPVDITRQAQYKRRAYARTAAEMHIKPVMPSALDSYVKGDDAAR